IREVHVRARYSRLADGVHSKSSFTTPPARRGVLQCKTSNGEPTGHRRWSPIHSGTITESRTMDRRLLNDAGMSRIGRKYARSVSWIDVRRSTGTIGPLEKRITACD
ncbi:hypothetical protein X777_08982, partial [Ooceraea biroi]